MPARHVLPSWRPGATRDSILGFLRDAEALPAAERVAVFDNDGTLCCERPTLVQYEFFAAELTASALFTPEVRDRPEYAAVLDSDGAALHELGLVKVALALAELFGGMEPDEFARRCRAFMATARHGVLDRPTRLTVFQPMLELIDELRRRQFTVAIVSGGGTEFVRAISDELYGVPAELVVGTLIEYEFERSDAGRPVVRRSTRLGSVANEGAAKVLHIQSHLGRRPILGVGNSSGDREMLEWATDDSRPSLALLVDHDDAEREFEYVGTAATFADAEPITDVAHRLGWTVVSIATDWNTVFASTATQ